jgi:hypothetical protein
MFQPGFLSGWMQGICVLFVEEGDAAMLVLEMGPSGSVSVSIKQRVFDPDTDTDPDPDDPIASSLAASRGHADQGPANGIGLFLCPRLRAHPRTSPRAPPSRRSPFSLFPKRAPKRCSIAAGLPAFHKSGAKPALKPGRLRHVNLWREYSRRYQSVVGPPLQGQFYMGVCRAPCRSCQSRPEGSHVRALGERALGDKESMSKLLQRKQEVPVNRRPGLASAPTFR